MEGGQVATGADLVNCAATAVAQVTDASTLRGAIHEFVTALNQWRLRAVTFRHSAATADTAKDVNDVQRIAPVHRENLTPSIPSARRRSIEGPIEDILQQRLVCSGPSRFVSVPSAVILKIKPTPSVAP